nr:pectinesterase inhibitor-like [Ipomoea batatas]
MESHNEKQTEEDLPQANSSPLLTFFLDAVHRRLLRSFFVTLCPRCFASQRRRCYAPSSSTSPCGFTDAFAALSIVVAKVTSVPLLHHAQKGEIERLCAHTEAPDLCISIMKSDDPNGFGSKLRNFVLKTLGKVLDKATDIMKDTCPAIYVKLNNHIGDAIRQIQNKEIAAGIFNVMAAINDALNCYQTAVIVGILKIALKILKLLK